MTIAVAAIAVATLTIGVITLRSTLRLIDTQSGRIVALEAQRDCLVAALDAAFSAPTSDAICDEEAR